MKTLFLILLLVSSSSFAHGSSHPTVVNVYSEKTVGPKLATPRTEIVTTKYNYKGKAYEETYVVTTFTNGNKCYRRITVSNTNPDSQSHPASCVKAAGE